MGIKTEHFLTPEYKEIFQKMLDVLDEKGRVDVGDFTKTDEEWDLAFKLMDNCKLINLQKPISDLIE